MLFQTLIYLGVLFLLAWPLGRYLTSVMEGGLSTRFVWLGKFELGLCRVIGANADEDMPWWRYAIAIIAFNAVGMLSVYGLQRFQASLPLNPAGMAAVTPDSAFNTAISFVTNTNWQGYAGESTMSYLTQMLALTVQNFLSAANGVAGMSRMMQANVIATSGRAVEAAGDVDVLLDKTGTITLGNR
jgi:K+-transporting ATPase ATPase A chain